MERITDTSKSAAAEQFWIEIGEKGRRQYIRAIDDDMKYSLWEWQSIPKPVRSALGREMNTHYRGSEVGTRRGRTFNPEKTLTYQEALEVWRAMTESAKKRLLLSLNVNLEQHPNTLWSELDQSLQHKLMKILGDRTKSEVSKVVSENILAVIFGLVAGNGGAINQHTLIGKLMGFGLSYAAAKIGLKGALNTSLLAGGQTRWLTNIHKGITFINAEGGNGHMVQRADYDHIMTLKLGDEVAFRDYKKEEMIVGKIAEFNDDYAHIKQNNGNGSYTHVPRRELIKTDEIMFTAKHGMTAWNRLEASGKYDLLKEHNLPLDLVDKEWAHVPLDVRDILMKKYHTEVFEQLDKKKASEVDLGGLASEYNTMLEAAGGASMDEKKKNNFDMLYDKYMKNTVKYKDQFYKVVGINSTGLLTITNAQGDLVVAPTQVEVGKKHKPIKKDKHGDIICSDCGDTFAVKEEYVDHMKHHDGKEKAGYKGADNRYMSGDEVWWVPQDFASRETATVVTDSSDDYTLVRLADGSEEVALNMEIFERIKGSHDSNLKKLELFGTKGDQIKKQESLSDIEKLESLAKDAVEESEKIVSVLQAAGVESYTRLSDRCIKLQKVDFTPAITNTLSQLGVKFTVMDDTGDMTSVLVMVKEDTKKKGVMSTPTNFKLDGSGIAGVNYIMWHDEFGEYMANVTRVGLDGSYIVDWDGVELEVEAKAVMKDADFKSKERVVGDSPTFKKLEHISGQ